MLRQEDLLNPGGRGCSEPILHHCSPAWATELDSVKRKKGVGERERERRSKEERKKSSEVNLTIL